MGWANVDTVRCEGCAVYTETADVIFLTDGRAFCIACGPPRAARVAADWEPPSLRARLEPRVRIAALVMLAVTLCFPLAACVSQL